MADKGANVMEEYRRKTKYDHWSWRVCNYAYQIRLNNKKHINTTLLYDSESDIECKQE